MAQLTEEQRNRVRQICERAKALKWQRDREDLLASTDTERAYENTINDLLGDIEYCASLLDSDSQAAEASPIDMMLFCPRCGTRHVDAPEDDTSFRHRMEAWSLNAEWQDRTPQRWTNPPHKSHLCHNCFAVWRPADVPTNGVAQIKTRGKEDNTWTNSAAVPASVEFDAATLMRDKCVEKVKAMRDDWYKRVEEAEEDSAVETVMYSRVYAADKIAAELQSLTLDQVKPGET